MCIAITFITFVNFILFRQILFITYYYYFLDFCFLLYQLVMFVHVCPVCGDLSSLENKLDLWIVIASLPFMNTSTNWTPKFKLLGLHNVTNSSM